LVDKQAELYRGRIVFKTGESEIIEILHTDFSGEDQERVPVSNADFGAWIRARASAGSGSFVYINPSNWSHTKAVRELTAVASPVLVEIPTLNLMESFRNSDQNVTRELITGIRLRASFAAIRKRMEKNVAYKARERNVYLFSDEEEFDDYIRKVLVKPVDETIRITESATKQRRNVSSKPAKSR
jgi:hypothetical protein